MDQTKCPARESGKVSRGYPKVLFAPDYNVCLTQDGEGRWRVNPNIELDDSTIQQIKDSGIPVAHAPEQQVGDLPDNTEIKVLPIQPLQERGPDGEFHDMMWPGPIAGPISTAPNPAEQREAKRIVRGAIEGEIGGLILKGIGGLGELL